MTAVILFNTKELKNSADFQNVYVIQDLDRPGAERILELENLMSGKGKFLHNTKIIKSHFDYYWKFSTFMVL